MATQSGVVVIGRNEGDRLRRCLQSVADLRARVVYVDSGSSDDSVPCSQRLGIAVIDLDLRTPFTAARARNEGFEYLLKTHPGLDYVFFVDGDCEVVRSWPERAAEFLDQHPDVAVVWGRRRERYPDRSVYNLLCDLEWSAIAPGETTACGGDAVMRVRAFREVGGFRSDLICGEEPELCVRLRQQSWRIWRLDEDMTLHDAAIYRFSQWWKRMVRGGYAFAQGAALHGSPPERFWVRESRSAWLWGLVIPLVLAVTVLSAGWRAVPLLLVYPLQVIRLALRGKGSARQNWWRAVSLVVCKFPEMLGQVRFLFDRLRHAQPRLIEYK